VPYDSQAGTYTGTIDVTQGSGTTAVRSPCASGLRLAAAFDAHGVSAEHRERHGRVRGTGASQGHLAPKYYEFWEQHGLSPGVLFPGATVNRRTAIASTTGLAAGLSPWLNKRGPPAPVFLDTRLPLSLTHPGPTGLSDRSASRPT